MSMFLPHVTSVVDALNSISLETDLLPGVSKGFLLMMDHMDIPSKMQDLKATAVLRS